MILLISTFAIGLIVGLAVGHAHARATQPVPGEGDDGE